MYAGRQIGRNILRQMEGKPLKPFKFAGLGDACSLGRRKAVSHLKGMRFYGLPAWILWRLFFWWFVPTWERKADIAFDWMMAPIFGRDIVGVRVATPFGLRREHYETGQAVVRQGEVGQQIYVIASGTADIIRETPEGEVLVTTLGLGRPLRGEGGLRADPADRHGARDLAARGAVARPERGAGAGGDDPDLRRRRPRAAQRAGAQPGAAPDEPVSPAG